MGGQIMKEKITAIMTVFIAIIVINDVFWLC